MEYYEALIQVSATLEGYPKGKTFERVKFVAFSEEELVAQLEEHYGKDFANFEQHEDCSHIAALTRLPKKEGGVPLTEWLTISFYTIEQSEMEPMLVIQQLSAR